MQTYLFFQKLFITIFLEKKIKNKKKKKKKKKNIVSRSSNKLAERVVHFKLWQNDKQCIP